MPLLAGIEKSGLSVEYMYSFLRAAVPGTAHLILRFAADGGFENASNF